jgi:hypothetical protein
MANPTSWGTPASGDSYPLVNLQDENSAKIVCHFGGSRRWVLMKSDSAGDEQVITRESWKAEGTGCILCHSRAWKK